jgi:hypothetical protein
LEGDDGGEEEWLIKEMNETIGFSTWRPKREREEGKVVRTGRRDCWMVSF